MENKSQIGECFDLVDHTQKNDDFESHNNSSPKLWPSTQKLLGIAFHPPQKKQAEDVNIVNQDLCVG